MKFSYLYFIFFLSLSYQIRYILYITYVLYVPALSYRNCVITPGWWLMRTGYHMCFQTLYDEKKKNIYIYIYIYILKKY